VSDLRIAASDRLVALRQIDVPDLPWTQNDQRSLPNVILGEAKLQRSGQSPRGQTFNL